MRYTSKLYVMDVLDQIVVSGYVHNASRDLREAPVTFDFTWQTRGAGIGDPEAWLRRALLECARAEQRPPAPKR